MATSKMLKNTTIVLMAMQAAKEKKVTRTKRTDLVLDGRELYLMLDRYKPVQAR